MRNKTLITIYFSVYIASLLNLVLNEYQDFSTISVILKYSVFFIFLMVFGKRLSTNRLKYELTVLDRLLVALFVYNFFQSLYLGSDFKGSFKIIFGHLFIVLVQDRRNSSGSNLQFYRMFSLIFWLLMLAHIYYFILDPMVVSMRVTRVNIGALNGNEIAGAFTTMFPFAALLVQNRFSRNQKKATIIFLIFYLYILLFYNGSRFAIFSSVLSTVIIYYYTFSFKKKQVKGALGKIVAIVSIFIAAFFFAGDVFFGNDEFFSKKFTQVTSGDYQEGNLAGRIGGIWMPLIKHTSENSMLLGFGNESVKTIAAKTTFWVNEKNQVQQYFRDVHNFFITLYVEMGLIGLLIFFTLYLCILSKLIIALNVDSAPIFLNEKIAVLCSFIGFSTWLFTANSWYSGGWFIVFFYVHFLNKVHFYGRALSHARPAHI